MESIQSSLSALQQHLRQGKAKGLDVIFTRLGQEGPYRVADVRYPLQVLDPLTPIYPQGPNQGGPSSAAQQLSQLLTTLEQKLPQAQSAQAGLNLLEACGGLVAAQDQNGQEVGGVSWFDQARLHIALEACGPEVLVLRTDISGIQDFIYEAESEKALKSLRARSFYLELLAVHTLRQLLAQTGMTRANVAYLGGGGYQLYLPARCQAQVLAYAQAFDEWLWQTHQGTLGFSLAFTVVGRADIESAAYQPELMSQLSRQKARRRRGHLSQLFEPRSPLERQQRAQKLSDQLIEFGAKLPSATHIEVRSKAQADAEGGLTESGLAEGWVLIEDLAYRPYHAAAHKPLPAHRIALNSFDDLEAFPMLTGNYVTRVQDVPSNLRIGEAHHSSTADLEQLAALALGQPRVALFRCDADNMGTFFSGGIPSHNAARHATLSRLMSLFFQGHVNALCAGRDPLLPQLAQAPRSPNSPHGRYLHIIYSGGDDAVVVGAWNEVLSFAVDLRRAYQRFTGGNPLLGLSGGAFIAKAKYPLRRMAERAHDAEMLAKQAKDKAGKVVKDGFVPFLTMDTPSDDPRSAVRWNVFADVLGSDVEHTLDVLADFLTLTRPNDDARDPEDGLELELKRAFLWKLQAFAEREGDVWRLPMLHYALARATPPDGKKAEWQKLQQKLLQPQTWPHLGHVLGFLHLARPPAQDR